MALFALQIADLGSTMLVIHAGGHEANPLANFVGLIQAKVICCSITPFIRARWMLRALVAFFTGVFVWNLHFLVRL